MNYVKLILRTLIKHLISFLFKSLFIAIDKNKDGKLSKQEIKEFSELARTRLAELRLR